MDVTTNNEDSFVSFRETAQNWSSATDREIDEFKKLLNLQGQPMNVEFCGGENTVGEYTYADTLAIIYSGEFENESEDSYVQCDGCGDKLTTCKGHLLEEHTKGVFHGKAGDLCGTCHTKHLKEWLPFFVVVLQMPGGYFASVKVFLQKTGV